MILIDKIDGELLKNGIINSAYVLSKNKNIVDELNVFPVPDGDTGTNMSLTMDQAANELKKLSTNDLKKVVDAAAWGSLMGARGNSGVILSQLFRGFSQSVSSNKKTLKAKEFALAFKSGVDAAYHAVMRPVEGTILTVAREMADKMIQESDKNEDIESMLVEALKHGEKVLSKTPEMLKALKEAKVVDAGGKGLIFIMKGFIDVIKGQPAQIDVPETEEKVEEKKDYESIETDIKFMYCTELFIEGEGIDEEMLKERFSELGDFLIVIGMDNLVKVHVHTNHPGQVLEEALKWGELSKIKVDNMKLQHEEMISKSSVNEKAQEIQDEIELPIKVIAVSQGEGLNEIFKSLGADVIEGGQTMNPSIENILSAIEKGKCNDIIILPNNKNIVMTAEQTKSISKKNIYVLPTKTVPQGLAALIAFNPMLSVEENLKNMQESFNNVVTGEVTYAIRDSKMSDTEIKQGDILGIKDNKLLIVGKDKEQVLYDLIDEMIGDRQDGIITIYYGKEVDESSIEKIEEVISKKYEDFDLECYNGGQNLYFYIVSVE